MKQSAKSRSQKTLLNLNKPVSTLGAGRAVAAAAVSPPASEASAALLRELVAHLRQNRTQLREVWAKSITQAQLLTAMSDEEIFVEATSVDDNYVEVLETGSVEAFRADQSAKYNAFIASADAYMPRWSWPTRGTGVTLHRLSG